MSFISMKPPSRVFKKKRSENADLVLSRLSRYLDDEQDEPIQFLCGFWEDQQNAISYKELKQAVVDGFITEETYELWTQDYSNMVINQMSKTWTAAMIAGAYSEPILDPVSGIFRFNTQTPGILNWISERGAELVTNSSNVQREAIKWLLNDKTRNGYGVDELSRLIRPCIGLTKGQASAAAKYYDNMLKTLKEDHPRTAESKLQKKALERTTTYAGKLHRQRAMNIARTEMAKAYNHGADQGIRQAQKNYLIGKVIKRWITSGDERVCPECEELDGVEIGMEEVFRFGNRRLVEESDLTPPAHPSCACAVEYIEVDGDPMITEDEEPHEVMYDDDLRSGSGEYSNYTEEELNDQMNKINTFLDGYSDNQSNYSGKTTYNDNMRHSGVFHRKTGDIEVRHDTPVKTKIHELLHARTIYDNTGTFANFFNSKLNEGATEYYAELICSANGVPVTNPSYRSMVSSLRDLGSFARTRSGEMRFAKTLFDTPYSERYNYLKAYAQTIKRRSYVTQEDKKMINQIVRSMRGFLKKKRIDPETVTTADEAIDVLELGWTTKKEYFACVDWMNKIKLSEEEEEKFSRSEIVEIIVHEPWYDDYLEERR